MILSGSQTLFGSPVPLMLCVILLRYLGVNSGEGTWGSLAALERGYINQPIKEKRAGNLATPLLGAHHFK